MTNPIDQLESIRETILALIVNDTVARDAKIELHTALEAVESALMVQESMDD